MAREPYGHTIFCDDIRHEVSHKVSLIGVYKGELILLSDFPARLPKFCLSVTYAQSLEDPIEPTTLMVFLPGDTADSATVRADVPMSHEQREQFRAEPDTEDTPMAGRELSFNLNIIMDSLQIKEPGRIRVRVYRAGREVRCGTLKVRKATPEEAAVHAPST